MIEAMRVLSDLRAQGYQLAFSGDSLRVSPSHLPDDLRGAVKANLAEIRTLLARDHQRLLEQAAATFPGSGIVDDDLWLQWVGLARGHFPVDADERLEHMIRVLARLLSVGTPLQMASALGLWRRLEQACETTP